MVRKLTIMLAAILACVPAFAASTGMVTVSATNLTDSSGNLITNATVKFAPVTPSGKPTSYLINGVGIAVNSPVTATITSGAFSLQIADTSLTNPVNVCFSVTITSNLTGNSLLGPGYSCVQPSYSNTWRSAGTCNFNKYVPAGPPNPLFELSPGLVGNPSSGQFWGYKNGAQGWQDLPVNPATVTDGSGATTAGLIAQSTSTAHTISYSSALPAGTAISTNFAMTVQSGIRIKQDFPLFTLGSRE